MTQPKDKRGYFDLAACNVIWGLYGTVSHTWQCIYCCCHCYQADHPGPWASCFFFFSMKHLAVSLLTYLSERSKTSEFGVIFFTVPYNKCSTSRTWYNFVIETWVYKCVIIMVISCSFLILWDISTDKGTYDDDIGSPASTEMVLVCILHNQTYQSH